jgi:myo-inositol-1(or 4)-monophosphatase
MPYTQDELLAVALEAARAGAAELTARFGRRQQNVRTKTTPTDPVSDADLAAERAVRAVLAERRPNDTVIGEEGGEVTGAGAQGAASGADETRGVGSVRELRWVVDPLDGTVNFLYEIPMFAVSVACEDSDGALAGVVIDPIRDECFAATRSAAGATLNGEPITGSSCSELATALVATGFGYDPVIRAAQAEIVSRVLPAVRDIRRAGAAALDLCWTACGRFDAFYERGLNAWDMSAGALVCERAGLSVRGLSATDVERPGVVAAPAGIIDGLVALLEA